MKRFRFTLQALHTLRQRQENVALEHYGAALLHRQDALRLLQRAENDLAQTWLDLQQHLQAGCDAALALQARSLCAAVEERRTRAHQDLGQAELDVQRTFAAMIEARRQREIVDKLHDRQLRAHEHAAAVTEHKLLDELALRRLPAALDWRSGN